MAYNLLVIFMGYGTFLSCKMMPEICGIFFIFYVIIFKTNMALRGNHVNLTGGKTMKKLLLLLSVFVFALMLASACSKTTAADEITITVNNTTSSYGFKIVNTTTGETLESDLSAGASQDFKIKKEECLKYYKYWLGNLQGSEEGCYTSSQSVDLD